MDLRLIVVAALVLVPGSAAATSHLRTSAVSAERYGETFTFVSDLEDGTYVQVQLAVTNLGPGSGTGLCRLLIVAPGRPALAADERVSRSAWSWKGGAEEALEIGGCRAVASSGAAVVTASVAGGRVRLELPPLAPLATPGGRIVVEDSRYESRILLAPAPARAELQLAGEEGRTLAGGAFADHSRSDLAPADLAREWIRFRALRGPAPLVILGRRSPGGDVAPLCGIL